MIVLIDPLASKTLNTQPAKAKPAAQDTHQPEPNRQDSHCTKDTHDIELHFAITDIGGNVRELCTPEGEIEWRGDPATHDDAELN